MADIIRQFAYDDDTGEPVMILRKNREALKTYRIETPVPVVMCIRQRDAWRYSEEHNPMFIQQMWDTASKAFDLFDLGLVTVRKMGQLAGMIQEGLEDLIRIKPQQTADVSLGDLKIKQTAMDGSGSIEMKNELIASVPVN